MSFARGFVLHWVEAGFEKPIKQAGFDAGATLETPGGADDFDGEGFLEGALGKEIAPETGADCLVFRFLFGTDEAVHREEAELEGVAGGTGFAFGGDGSGAVLGVELVGGDLGV